MIVGNIPPSERAPRVVEFYIQTHMNYRFGVVNGSELKYIGSFTAPFTCTAVVNAWAKFHIGPNYDCFVVISFTSANTNLAPTNYPQGVFQDGIINTYTQVVDIPYMAYYANVAAGTTVSMWTTTYVGISNPLWEWNMALVRCIRI